MYTRARAREREKERERERERERMWARAYMHVCIYNINVKNY